MNYENFQYLFPPRPKHKISLKTLSQYDNGQYYGQVKANGSNATLYISPDKKWQLWNRHNEPLTNYKNLEFEKLHRGNGWVVLNAEYLNKAKRHIDGKEFNHKFIIFDILVYNGEILTGKTLEERVSLLEQLYPCEPFRITESGIEHDPYICQTDVNDIYKVSNFMGNFEKLYNEVIKSDVYEGLVLKRKSAILQPLFREGNNADSMIKIRKETKNYRM